MSPCTSRPPSALAPAFLALIAGLLGPFLPAPADAAPASRPNVLFIAIDDLRPELGCYGAKHIISPNLDRLASQSVLFNRAYCQAPICMSSRASLLTSIHPTRTKLKSTEAVISQHLPGAITLPQAFRQHGYYALANGKIMHEETDTAAVSWDEPVWYPKTKALDFLAEDSKRFISARGRGPVLERPDVPDQAYSDGQIAEKTIADLKRLATTGRPFFLGCGFFKPHLPFYAPKKYWDLYRPEEIALAANRHRPKNAPPAISGSREFANYHLRDMTEGSDEWHRTLRHGYYACVSYVDACVGRVLHALDELGLGDNTIVMLWGDHGWHLGEHNFWGKHNLLHRSLHAPLIVRLPSSAPGFARGVKTEAIVEFTDMFPTLLELAGLPLSEKLRAQIEGVSFVPVLRDPTRPWKQAAFSWWNNDGVTITTADYSYTEWTSGHTLLTNRRLDPDENVNVVDAPEERAARDRLQAALRAGWPAFVPKG